MVNGFRGEYYFLSNFSPSKITLNGYTFDNGESAFQSFKDLSMQHTYVGTIPSYAKRKGRQGRLRKDWESIKDQIMYDVVKAKFTQNEDLKQKLLDTGYEILIEGNDWNDTYWGMCNGVGENMLGRILMLVREEIRSQL